MTRGQTILIGFSLLLFLGLYLGGSTKPSEIKSAELTRAKNSESTDISTLLLEAKPSLSPLQTAELLSLEDRLSKSTSNEDSTKISVYKDIASTWYKYKRADISGFYAMKVAELENTETAWSIAGTTMTLGLKNADQEKIKRFCSKNAIKAFENAITMDPGNVQHRTNLAICYAEYPPKENPMQGIMMLLDLNKKHPDDIGVLITLARFGMQTGQFEKVEGRLQKVLSLEPDNRAANCMMVDVLTEMGKTAEAGPFQAKCGDR